MHGGPVARGGTSGLGGDSCLQEEGCGLDCGTQYSPRDMDLSSPAPLLPPISKVELAKAQRDDPVISSIMAERKQLVLPTKYRQLALEHLHDRMGHVGQERVIHLMRERFYWPHMKREVEEYITKRCPCIKAKKQSLMSEHPWEV